MLPQLLTQLVAAHRANHRQLLLAAQDKSSVIALFKVQRAYMMAFCVFLCFSGCYDQISGCYDQISSQDFLFGLWMPGRAVGAGPRRYLPTGVNTYCQSVNPSYWPQWAVNSDDLSTGYGGPLGGDYGGCLQGHTYAGSPNEICGGDSNWSATQLEVWRPACTTCSGHGSCDRSTRVCACEAGCAQTFAEHNSPGPGANPRRRLRWSKQLSAADKEKRERFTMSSVLSGWRPSNLPVKHDDSAARQDSGAPYTLRVEATSSTNMDVWQVMAYDEKGINMLRNCSRVDQKLPLAQQQARNCVADGRAYNSNGPPGWVPTLISDSGANWQNASSIGYHRMLSLTLLTDGVVYDPKRKTHEFDAQTGKSPTRGPMVGAFLEFDLSRLNHSATGSSAQRPSRVDLFTAASAADNGWHTVSLLDSKRNVVSVQTLRHGVGFPKNGRPKLAAESPKCKLFVEASDAMHRALYDSYIYNCSFALPPYSGDAVKIPASAANWQPLHTTGMPTTVAPVPSDRSQRLAAFAARDSDSSVKALSEQLFGGGLLLRSVETAASFALFEKGSHRAAIDAWQTSFFLQLKPRNIHYSYNPALTACCSYSSAADDLLANFSVTFGPGVLTTGTDVSLAKYEVGAINWMNFADDLQGVQNLAFVSANFGSLLTAYNESKAAGAANTKYIERWAALLDDWTLNFFQDADKACKSGVNAKNMFVMLGANYYGALLERLGDLEADAQISQVMPSTTMARLLLKLNAEYVPAYFRVARGTLFNHDTSGLAANYIVARYIQQFYSGRLLMGELRDHVQRWMAYGETAYGSMIEIGDEGHFAMPLDNLAVTMDLFDQDQPAWWTRQLRTRCRDMFRNMQQYYFRHAGPGGAWHRFGHVVPNGNRFLNFNDPYRENPVCANGCGVTNTTRKIVINDTYTPWVLAQINLLYGTASGPRPTVNTTPAAKVAAAQQLYDSASKLVSTYPASDSDPSILSEYRSDVMPYAGLHYLRSGWGKSEGRSVGDIILHCIAPPGSGSVAADMSLAADPEKEGDAFFENPGACQLSMSAADGTKQAVLMPLAKLTATRLNGDSPLPTYPAHGTHPGSKTTALSYASQTPVTGRFYSGTNLDLQEPVYSGTWATATSKYVSKKYQNLTGRQEQVMFPAKHTQGNWSRTFVAVRPYRAIFSIEDFVPASTERAAQPAELGTSIILQLASGFEAVDNRITVDSSSGTVSSHNGVVNQTSVTAHFAGTGLKYSTSKPAKPTIEYSALFPSATFITEVEVEVTRSSSAAPLLSLMFPTEPGQPPAISDVTVLPTGDGIDASTHDGGKLCLRNARGTLSAGKGCFGLALPCTTVFAWCISGTNVNDGAACAGRIEGVALGCSGGTSPSDFAFNHSAANGYMKTRIGRPLHKPTISGGSGVISKPVTLQMTSPEADAGLAEIRFTTDGSDPTKDSALFEHSKGLLVDHTMLIKAAAFCAAGHCNADRPEWTSDGTQVSAVQYADFTMKVPAAALPSNGTTQLKPGLCARSRGDSSWSELYATSGTRWGFGTGTIVAEPGTAFASAARCMNFSGGVYPQVSVDGVFTAAATGDFSFIAPEEYRMPRALTKSVGFDLRLWLDGEEVALSQLPGQGLGAWHVSLVKGPHSFRCVYTDGRCFTSASTLVPGAFYGLWQDYPQPWSTNTAPLSALSYIPPGATTPQSLGADLFKHDPSTCDAQAGPSLVVSLKSDDAEANRAVSRYQVSWASPALPDVSHDVPVGRPKPPAGPFVGNGDVSLLFSGNRSTVPGSLAAGDAQCNTTAWDAICPPQPANWQKCEACCQAHKALMFKMGCVGPIPHWNYTWQQHCEGKPPPPVCSAWDCNCARAERYYCIVPGVSWGCAPKAAQEWWTAHRCSPTQVSCDPTTAAPECLAAISHLDWQQWLYLSKNDLWGSDKFLQSDGIHLSAGRVGILVAPSNGSAAAPVHGRVDLFPRNASFVHTLSDPSGGDRVFATTRVLENNAVLTTLTCTAKSSGACRVELLLSDTDGNHYGVAQDAGANADHTVVWWRKDNLREALNAAYVGSCDPRLPLQSVERRFTVGNNGVLRMVNGSCLWSDESAAPGIVTSGDCAQPQGAWKWAGPASKGDVVHTASSKCLSVVGSQLSLGVCGTTPWSQAPSANASQVYLSAGSRCIVVVPDNNNNTLGVAVGVADAAGALVPGKATRVSANNASAGMTLSLFLQSGAEYTVITGLTTLRDMGCAGIRPQWEACLHSPQDAAASLVYSMASNEARAAAIAASDHFWDGFWAASSVDLTSGATVPEAVATIERWYFLNQYLLGCTTRDGKVTSALDGFVCIEPVPWNDQFTLDYNLEATFWGAGSSNRLDFIHPVMASTTNPGAVAVARLRARSPGAWNRNNGALWPGRVGATVAAAECNPACPNLTTTGFEGASWPGAAMPLGDNRLADSDLQVRFVGGLLSTNLIQYWEYSRNVTTLREKIYPFVKDVAEFYRSYVVVAADGKLQFPYSCAQEFCSCRNAQHIGGSPPAVPAPNMTLQCKHSTGAFQCAPDIHTGGGSPDGNHNAHADIAFASYAFRNAARFAKILGVDSTMAAAWQVALDSMPDYPTADFTFIAGAHGSEFNSGPGYLVEAEYGHHAGVTPRNSSVVPVVWPWCNSEYPIANFAAMWPTDEIGITQTSDAKLLARAKQTVYALNDYTGTPWAGVNGFCQSWPAAARLSGRRDAERLVTSIAGGIAAVVGNNGCGSFEGGRGMLENIGATMAINDLLLQSHGKYMRFFPVWNATALGPASFTTLRAYGAFLVSGAIDSHGTVADVLLESKVGGDVVFESPWPGPTAPKIVDGMGASVSATVVSAGVYSFASKASGKYTISKPLPASKPAEIVLKTDLKTDDALQAADSDSTARVDVTVKAGVVARTDPGFKCWTIDSSADRQFFTRNLSDPQLHYLAAASLPGYIRFGGTGNDLLRYSMH
eukprot:SAG31_NODE_1278_length_9041_cov_3.415231_1_plen_2946_part_10